MQTNLLGDVARLEHELDEAPRHQGHQASKQHRPQEAATETEAPTAALEKSRKTARNCHSQKLP